MNQSLINELRAEISQVNAEITKIKQYREDENMPLAFEWELCILRQAKATALQGIAVLVAADRRK